MALRTGVVTRRSLLVGGLASAAQKPAEPPPPDFLCPMDRDVRSQGPGKCPRCGMKLVANLPDPESYRLRVTAQPSPVRAGKPAKFEFTVLHPKSGAAVREFEIVHERIFHLFLIGQDLSFFAHEHPEQQPGGTFRFETVLPRAGAYRLVADCYPKGGTPQFLTHSLFTAGSRLAPPPTLAPDLAPKRGENISVEFRSEPASPLAGQETQLHFRIAPAEGLELYLGASGHLLTASDDLVDLVHDHPFLVNGGDIQFNVIFPRPRTYRVWVQFQRQGVVNTVAFNVPVTELR